MSDEPLSFEEHRRRREADPDLVRCARCRKMIFATSVRCPECGVHFEGEAQDFDPDAQARAGHRPWLVVLAILLLLTMFLGMFLGVFGLG